MPIDKVTENNLLLNFRVRHFLRKVERGMWVGANLQHQEIANKILSNRDDFKQFAEELLEGAQTTAGIELPVNSQQTAGPFMDALMQLLNWIKDNPEFILFIIQLFGG
jgi:hypothetical protein